MKTIKIFMASSSELSVDREQFEILIGRINQSWKNREFFIELVIWENFLDMMSAERLQNEYNSEIKVCDIFIMLFFTKVGIYTDEEFETAFGSYKANGKPFIYTYFKNATVFTNDLIESDIISLFKFKNKLKSLGHFHTTYNNIEDLKLKFSDQLNKLIEKKLIFKTNLLIEPSLEKLLEKVKSHCKENNIYIYAANLLHALLQNDAGITFNSLNDIQRGYPHLLYLKLEKIINSDYIELKKAKEYIVEDWFQRPEFRIASDLAEKESVNFVTEKHLLLGIIELNGGTIKMIQSDFKEKQWETFINSVKYYNINNTPIV